MTDKLSVKPGDTIWAWDVCDMDAKQYVVSDVFEDYDSEILVNHPSKQGVLCQFPESCCAKDRVSCLVKVMDCYDNQIKKNMAQVRELEEIVSKINNLIAETKG